MHQTEDRTRRARRLRSDMTGPESKFWSMVRNRGFDGLKFRRQSPVAGFVVDFLCPELKLVIELDGGVHRIREAKDAARDARIVAAGFKVLRFPNSTSLDNPTAVLDAIRHHSNIPSPFGGEGGSRSETVEGALSTAPRQNTEYPDRGDQPPHPSGSAAHLLPPGEKDEEDQ